MRRHLVITILADDRPGIVKSLSDTVRLHRGNWMESSMTRLGGKFAGILRVDCEERDQAPLRRALEALGTDALRISVERSEKRQDEPTRVVAIAIVGNDRPGIVEEVSRILADLNVNVEKLTTRCDSAPMSADQLFMAEIVAGLPARVTLERLQSSLEALSDDLTVELDPETPTAT